MNKVYIPKGVCSRRFDIDIEDGIINDIAVTGGCNGNLQGISALLRGQRAEDVIARLKGIRCGMKGTSCPDQIARALEAILAEDGGNN
ncbi:MAG: TIGR03905 family TSCPD domain-containing protein [Oscillospiraceae bacterium]